MHFAIGQLPYVSIDRAAWVPATAKLSLRQTELCERWPKKQVIQ